MLQRLKITKYLTQFIVYMNNSDDKDDEDEDNDK